VFDWSFQRSSGVPSPPAPLPLGSDVDPTTLTGTAAAAYVTSSNCLTLQLNEAGPQPLHLAVAATFAGTGTPGQVTLRVCIYDAGQTGLWLKVPVPAQFAVGTEVVMDLPVVMSNAAAWTIAILPSVASPAPGVYTFPAGLSESAVTASGGGGGGSATASNQGIQIGIETATEANTGATATSTATSAGAVGTPGATAPTTAVQVAGQDSGGHTRAVATDAAGNVQVGITGTVPLPTGAATAANQVTGNASAATTATETTATAAATATSAGTVGTPGATAPTTAVQVAGQDSGGHTRAVATDAAGNVDVNVENTVAVTASSLPLPAGAATSANQGSQLAQETTTATNTTTLAGTVASGAVQQVGAPDVTATASLTAVSTGLTLTVAGARPDWEVELSGTWVGIVEVQELIANTWTTVGVAFSPSSGSPEFATYTGVTSNGVLHINTAGANQMRVWVAAFTSGTIVVAARNSLAPHFFLTEDVNTGPGVSVKGKPIAVTGNVVTTQACDLLGFEVTDNDTGGTAYAMVFKGGLPATDQMADWEGTSVANNTPYQMPIPSAGIYCPTGLSIGLSTVSYWFQGNSSTNGGYIVVYRPRSS
jgi:hypothetical protein